jgi:hypothetical protein
VETLVNWDDVLEIALLGVDPSRIPYDLFPSEDQIPSF